MSIVQLQGDEAELFTEHNDHLLRVVRANVVATDALIEDACAMAWEVFMRKQPDRGPKLFGWLRTVAIREAWRLSSIQRRQPALEELVHPKAQARGETWEAIVPGQADTERYVDAKVALRILADLPEKQRRYLVMIVAGWRYDEIMRETGATYTNVNKHLTRARANVRRARQAA
jgi:RNA polymerase sigma factor (sigma-70 family)